MPVSAAMRSFERQQNGKKAADEDIQTALGFTAQLSGDGKRKLKACEFLKAAVEWIGNDVDSAAKRDALALAVQMPADLGKAVTVAALVACLTVALFADGAV